MVGRSITVADGLALSVCDIRPQEDGGRLPLVCLPGLSRNSRDFEPLANLLSAEGPEARRVIAIDSRGRGGSDWDPQPERYRLDVEAQDVVDVLRALDVSRAVVFGTSRGGLILHLLPQLVPDLVAGGVLNDIGPVIGIEGLIDIARGLTTPARYDAWPEAIAAVHHRYGDAFPALTEADWGEMARAIYKESAEGIVPDFDPAIAAPLQALTPSTKLADLWQAFDGLAALPLLVIRGETSRILSAETVTAMQARHSGLKAVTIPGQGHVPLPHHPKVLAPLRAFLSTLP